MFYASIVFEIFAYKYDFFVQLVQSILKYNRGIYMQNVLLRLREVQPSLSSTERQIAQFILENPDETTTLTIRDLARRSFSSPSSVVRICRVIGFQGYKELRHALTLELATLGENGSHREKDITPQDSLQEIVDKVTHKNIQSLLDTQRLLLLDELEQCVELIANARTVLLFGIGSSLCVAKDTYLKFLRLDKPCVVNEDSHSQLLQARNATAQDVGIVFSYSGQTMEMIQCIKEMKAQSLCEFLIPTGGSIFDVVRDKVIDEYRINLAWMTCTHPDNYGKAWAQLSYDKIFGDNTAYGPMDYISAGVPLSVYNVDDDETMDAVIPYYPKLKAIFTNYPSKLIQKLRAQGYAD